jgi:hypothetical protein
VLPWLLQLMYLHLAFCVFGNTESVNSDNHPVTHTVETVEKVENQ